MDKLWAPWRDKYVTLKKAPGCIFCLANKKKAQDAKRFILKKEKHVFSMLNAYPYNNGHVMIAPYRHVSSLEKLTQEETLGLFNLLNYTKKMLDKKLKPMGYNIGLNVGRCAGAGFPGHIHIHIVPRWQGDTNFMPVLSSTKVVPASLVKMYNTLKG